MNRENYLKQFTKKRLRVQQLLSSGLSVPEVAAKLQISRQRVYKVKSAIDASAIRK